MIPIENTLIYSLLIGKFVRMYREADSEATVGVVSDFHKHIDGGIVLQNAYNIHSNKYYSSVIACSLCIPQLGQGNYITEIIIRGNIIHLENRSNHSDSVDHITIEILNS